MNNPSKKKALIPKNVKMFTSTPAPLEKLPNDANIEISKIGRKTNAREGSSLLENLLYNINPEKTVKSAPTMKNTLLALPSIKAVIANNSIIRNVNSDSKFPSFFRKFITTTIILEKYEKDIKVLKITI